MVSSIDKITLLPAIILFSLAAYLAFLNVQVAELPTKTDLLNYATVSFIAGIILIAAWVVIWIISLGSEKNLT
jgi:hypothetical protein